MIDDFQSSADPKHCVAVLNDEINGLHEKLNAIVKEFIDKTGLKIKVIDTHIYKESSGLETFKGIEIQFGL